jgi:tetratricopeptide (TPR) repeat protein
MVSVALDAELGREVALKEIQDARADDQEARIRFVKEAELTGKLEHPGIIPIYGLGRDSTGRPYYAMRLIHGHSFLEAIRRFHAAEVAQSSPGDRTLQLRDMLGRFLNACDAIAYAHSRGVLHRDVKPDNIMLGPYGETLVVDWGLAKSLGQPVSDDAKVRDKPELIADDLGNDTRSGSVLGTPAYMSPEQSRGELDRLAPATDVFSLGATLFHMLTGQPPYQGEVNEILALVSECNFPRPRQLDSGIHRALEAICLKAMAREASDRYESPKDLADDLKRWLADEPVSCWREPWWIRARRWVRRHQTPVAAAAFTALAVAVLGGTGWSWYSAREQARLRKTQQAAQRSLDDAIRLGGQARGTQDLMTWGQAVAAAEQSKNLLDTAGDQSILRRRARDLLDELRDRRDEAQRTAEQVAVNQKMLRMIDDARLAATTARADGRFNHLARAPAYQKAFQDYAIDVTALPIDQAAEQVRSSSIREALVAALDDWATETDRDLAARLRSIAHEADPGSPLDTLRTMIDQDDVAGLIRLASSTGVAEWPSASLNVLARQLAELGKANEAVELLTRGRKSHLGDFWTNFELGMICQDMKPPQTDEAIRHLSAAAALRPQSSVVHNNLGNALTAKGRFDEAIDELGIASQLHPGEAVVHFNLGLVLWRRGRLDRAIEEQNAALRIDPKLADAHFVLAHAWADKQQSDVAIEHFRLAIRINPRDARYHSDLGDTLRAKGQVEEAIAEYRAAIRITPDDPYLHCYLGDALSDSSRLDEAIAAYRDAIRLRPENFASHNRLGNALDKKGLRDAAIAEYGAAIRLDPGAFMPRYNLGMALQAKGLTDEAIAEYRSAIRLKPDDFAAHNRLGTVLDQKGLSDQAIAEYRAAIALDPQAFIPHYNLGISLGAKGRKDEAIAEYRTAIRLKPSDADSHIRLGLILIERGLTGEATSEFRTAIQLDPLAVQRFNSIGTALSAKGLHDDAIAAYRAAIRLKPDDPESHYNLGVELNTKGQIDDAIGEYQAAIRLKRDYAEAHNNLGIALGEKDRNAEAIAEFRAAIRTKPDDHHAHHNLGLDLGAKGLLDEAITEYRAAIRLKPDDPASHEAMGNALRDKSEWNLAAEEYRTAIRLKPDSAQAHCGLGLALERVGLFRDALKELEVGHNLGQKDPDWRRPSERWLAECRRFIELEAKLPAILKAEAPDRGAAELLELAEVCYNRRMPAAATGLYEKAFALQTRPPGDTDILSLYLAISAAALSGAGHGNDNPAPDYAARARFRTLSLGWLKTALVAQADALQRGPASERRSAMRLLRLWQADSELAGIRRETELAKLPEPEHREFRKLWADVDALIRMAEANGPK